jgi:O-acetyl-ADP-ribose deacetylase (regulator of RNase III)
MADNTISPKKEEEIEVESETKVDMVSNFGSEKNTIVERIGNLFDNASSDSSLIHCVSRDLHMGYGIAVEFKKRFGSVDLLKAQDKQVGQVATLEISMRHSNKKFIYYLITKEHYWEKPRYVDLENALVNLKKHCLEHSIKELTMPRIGCGLDKMDWVVVRALLIHHFGDTDINITVFSLK